MNKSKNNSSFSSTAAPGTRCHNLRASLWRKFLGGIALLLIVSLTLSRAAQSVTLAWDPVPGPNIAGYKLHYGMTSGRPSNTVDVGNRTTAKVSTLNDGTTYFFSVSAYNTSAFESRPSREISYKTAAPAAAFTGKLTVHNGSGSGNYAPGTQVRVGANAAPAGKRFAGWTGDVAILVNPSSSTTTARVPYTAVTITASYSPVDKIRDHPRPEWPNQILEARRADIAGYEARIETLLANPSSPTTTATMPSTAVTITASYSGTMPPMYALTVNSGGGDGTYPAGTVVKLTADPPPPGTRFAGWRLDTSAQANRSAANTTLIMPARKLTISATYKR